MPDKYRGKTTPRLHEPWTADQPKRQPQLNVIPGMKTKVGSVIYQLMNNSERGQSSEANDLIHFSILNLSGVQLLVL
jgi:hypothetical protein